MPCITTGISRSPSLKRICAKDGQLIKKRSAFTIWGNTKRPRTNLEYALNHFPDMPSLDNALFLMAQIYTKVGDFDKADKTYNTIIRMFSFRAEEAKNLKAQLPQNQPNNGSNQGPQRKTLPAKP